MIKPQTAQANDTGQRFHERGTEVTSSVMILPSSSDLRFDVQIPMEERIGTDVLGVLLYVVLLLHGMPSKLYRCYLKVVRLRC